MDGYHLKCSAHQYGQLVHNQAKYIQGRASLDQDIQTVNYSYDGLRRLTGSDRFVNWDSTACNLWSEKNISYDKNGNIMSMHRNKDGIHDEELVCDYLGNRMMRSSVPICVSGMQSGNPN